MNTTPPSTPVRVTFGSTTVKANAVHISLDTAAGEDGSPQDDKPRPHLAVADQVRRQEL